MSTVVVVQHDRRLLSGYAAALKAAGYQVKGCCGPETFQCPILDGQRCTYCEDGDVLVYDPWLQPLGDESDSIAILGMLRWSYPAKPVVVAGGLGGLSAEIRSLAEKDPMVRLLPTPTTPDLVVEAVRDALAVAAAPALPAAATRAQPPLAYS